jgi:hypothetical protein
VTWQEESSKREAASAFRACVPSDAIVVSSATQLTTATAPSSQIDRVGALGLGPSDRLERAQLQPRPARVNVAPPPDMKRVDRRASCTPALGVSGVLRIVRLRQETVSDLEVWAAARTVLRSWRVLANQDYSAMSPSCRTQSSVRARRANRLIRGSHGGDGVVAHSTQSADSFGFTIDVGDSRDDSSRRPKERWRARERATDTVTHVPTRFEVTSTTRVQLRLSRRRRRRSRLARFFAVGVAPYITGGHLY